VEYIKRKETGGFTSDGVCTGQFVSVDMVGTGVGWCQWVHIITGIKSRKGYKWGLRWNLEDVGRRGRGIIRGLSWNLRTLVVGVETDVGVGVETSFEGVGVDSTVQVANATSVSRSFSPSCLRFAIRIHKNPASASSLMEWKDRLTLLLSASPSLSESSPNSGATKVANWTFSSRNRPRSRYYVAKQANRYLKMMPRR